MIVAAILRHPRSERVVEAAVALALHVIDVPDHTREFFGRAAGGPALVIGLMRERCCLGGNHSLRDKFLMIMCRAPADAPGALSGYGIAAALMRFLEAHWWPSSHFFGTFSLWSITADPVGLREVTALRPRLVAAGARMRRPPASGARPDNGENFRPQVIEKYEQLLEAVDGRRAEVDAGMEARARGKPRAPPDAPQIPQIGL